MFCGSVLSSFSNALFSWPFTSGFLILCFVQESGLNERVNNWDQVDDFNWLVSGTHSPNWSLLPPEQRRSSWDLPTTS